MTTPTVTPLRAVLDAFGAGARSRADVARITGLRADTVDAAVEHLLRIGRLLGKELTTGCPSGGCGSCASGVGDQPGCGSSAPSPRRSGPALVELTVADRQART